MEIFNNTTKVVKDDLKNKIQSGSRISIAAACFSIYAYQELKAQLESCDELRFIFTSPTFVAEKTQKERKELTDEKSESYKAGYKTICEIGEERIRCAGKKIREETGADIDYGFRVLRVDSSNMKDVYYKPSDYIQEQIFEAYSPKTQRKVL